ncbi:hypothetical protein A3218_27825 [Pseudomonas chlororaphis]|uniref:hypothetical protein n=1 Tax=Pseudomonas chlororaphis TaxID=587753 RepID=UPI000789E318|nr:hypothetical protein [Pseudomonas chlororaphis]AMS17914.1 hypothetical protein A3218_27825 [Pseudomonas chlororaphis]
MESDTSVASKAAPKPAAQTTVAKPPKQLDPQPKLPKSCETSFEKVKTPCSTTFGEVIYATKEQMFYLLPDRAATSIKEAMKELEDHLSAGKSPEERQKAMNKLGLLEYFLEPKLANFLEGEQRSRMLEIEKQEPYIDQPTMAMRIKAAKREAEYAAKAQGAKEQPNSYLSRELASTQQDQFLKAHEEGMLLQRLHHEWKKLKKIAVAQAEKEGYIYENGNLFTPEALEARKRVQTYLKARKELIDDDELTTLSADDLAKNKKFYLDATNCASDGKAQMCRYLELQAEERKRLEKKFSAYIDAILKVADYGLALPEFALIPENGAIEAGIEQFKSYLETEQQQNDVSERIRNKYKAWIDASGQNIPAPSGLIDAEQAEWERLQQSRIALRTTAEAAVAKTTPLRHLLWEPEQFEPKPEERRVKAGFPLREVSLLSAVNKPLKHFSLLNLEGIKKVVKEDLSKIGADLEEDLVKVPGNSSEKSTKDTTDNSFHEWLRLQGAIAIKDQESNWFDTQGWFDVELFYKYLQSKNYKVSTLEDASVRQEWGLRLRQLLFKGEVRSQLRLFDKSPQAQLIRCLSPAQSMIHKELKLEGPEFTLADGFKASAEASFGIDLARGEVELLKVDLPERSRAKEFVLNYQDYQDQPQTLNLGRFSLHLGARAWGYAGASLLLSSSIELGAGNVRGGMNLQAIENAERPEAKRAIAVTQRSAPMQDNPTSALKVEDGAKAEFSLFAGVQAGVLLTGALNWAPPQQVVLLRTAPTPGMSGKDNANKASQWFSLARLTAGFTGSLGAGANADVTISLHEGRFIMRLKASLIVGAGGGGEFEFEVGYDGVTELINLIRREMHKNQGHRLVFVTQEAETFIDRLNFIGTAGMNVAMIYMMGWDIAMSLYESLTGGGRGGPIAHTIMTYRDQAELEMWVLNATPSALGPMLMTLLSAAESFNVIDVASDSEAESREDKHTYNKSQAHLLQQQAIERILGWIVERANQQGTVSTAQKQFEDACMRMSRFGTKDPNPKQAYCENRLKMDNFMSEGVQNLYNVRNDRMRERYKKHVSLLGANLDGFCTRKTYYGRTYLPHGQADYVGSSE